MQYNYAILGGPCREHSMAILDNTKFFQPDNPIYSQYYTNTYQQPISLVSQLQHGLVPFPEEIHYPEHIKSGFPRKPITHLIAERYKPGGYENNPKKGGCRTCG